MFENWERGELDILGGALRTIFINFCCRTPSRSSERLPEISIGILIVIVVAVVNTAS